ncbi:MAG: DUF5333 domain-containing protein [Pseudomonadota bacterium]
MASAAAAKPPLRDTVIDDALLSIGLADEIRKTCPDISARMVRALRTINGLKDQAIALGYSEAEIDAYRKSEAEKARLRARGAARLKAEGVAPGDKEAFCAFGRREIEKGSQIGVLLR